MFSTTRKTIPALVLLSFVSALLLGSASVSPLLWWCTVPGLALLAYTIEAAPKMRQAILIAYGVGVLKIGIVMSWLLSIYPVDWLTEVSHTTQLIVLIPCYLGIGFVIGTGFILLTTIRYNTRWVWPLRALAYGVALVCAELLGAFLFSLYTYGPGSFLNTHFDFGMAGYTLADHGILKYLAVYGGVYILSLVCGFLAYCTRFLFPKRKYLGIAFVLLFICTGYIVLPQISQPTSGIAAIGTSFPSFRMETIEGMKKKQAILHKAVREALKTGATTVVLPEDARFGFDVSSTTLFEELASMSHAPGAVVVDSYRTHSTDSSVTLRAYIYDIDAQTTYSYDKKYLVPLGEYVPYLFSGIRSTFSHDTTFSPMQYTQGTAQIVSDAPTYIPSVLFCFENIAGSLAKEVVHTHSAALMVHPVSHSWFHAFAALENQERQTLIVQSLYTGVPIVQAGNMAPNVLYTPDGKVHEGTIYRTGEKYSITLF